VGYYRDNFSELKSPISWFSLNIKVPSPTLLRFWYLCLIGPDVPAVQGQADALLHLATAQGFPLWVGSGIFWQGWILAVPGQGEAGLAQMHQGIAKALLPSGPRGQNCGGRSV
jgi:hypothetical protein